MYQGMLFKTYGIPNNFAGMGLKSKTGGAYVFGYIVLYVAYSPFPGNDVCGLFKKVFGKG